jgi:hypothetical protein
MVEADEDEIGAARESLIVRDEPRKLSPVTVQARIQRLGRFAGEAVRAECEEVELGVGEDAVERLLPGVP